MMTDTQAMDSIAALMSGNEWSPDTLERIADIVRATGREIADSELPADEIAADIVVNNPAMLADALENTRALNDDVTP